MALLVKYNSIKDTRSLTFVSFQRALIVVNTKYEVSISYGSKVLVKVIVDNRQTIRQNKINTVYSFEFLTSYFCPKQIWDWFAESWIRPISNFLTKSFTHNLISPVLTLPSCQRAKRAKIKRGRNLPCIQYAPDHSIRSIESKML